MRDGPKQEILERSLERAAERVGDITPAVFAKFYADFPAAKAEFDHHAPDDRNRLEGEMIEQVLFCLMGWFENRAEIEILMDSTVPHHLDTLGVAGGHFIGLLTTVCDTLIATIPAECDDERAVWNELTGALCAQFTSSRELCMFAQ